MKILVNPNKGLGNSPDVTLISTERLYKMTWREPTYFRAGPCYFYQSRETGYTQFLFHHGKLQRNINGFLTQNQIGPGEYETNDAGGFGGSVFSLNVFGIGKVNLRGPWSGGCYCANQYLNKHVIHVNVYSGRKPNYSFHGEYRTVEVVNDWLAGSGWEIVREKRRHEKPGEVSYEAAYKGKLKHEFSTALMEELDERYQKAAAQRLRIMRGY